MSRSKAEERLRGKKEEEEERRLKVSIVLSPWEGFARAVLMPCGRGRSHIVMVKEQTGGEEVGEGYGQLLSAEAEKAGPPAWAARWNHLRSFLNSAAQVHSRSTESESFRGGSRASRFWRCSTWDSDAQKG